MSWVPCEFNVRRMAIATPADLTSFFRPVKKMLQVALVVVAVSAQLSLSGQEGEDLQVALRLTLARAGH